MKWKGKKGKRKKHRNRIPPSYEYRYSCPARRPPVQGGRQRTNANCVHHFSPLLTRTPSSRRHEQQREEHASCCFLLANFSVLIPLISTVTYISLALPYLLFFYQLTSSSLSLISPHSIFQSINLSPLYLADYIHTW